MRSAEKARAEARVRLAVDEGKKINWRDGVAAFWHILKFSLSR